MRMIVGICGHGVTGASSVVDFLKGYDEVQVIKGVEFQLLHQPDGINDLKYHLTINKDRIASNTAIKRFKRLKYSDLARRIRKEIGPQFDVFFDKYIDSIIQVAWKGKSSFDPIDVNNISYFGIKGFWDRALNAGLRRINKEWHYPQFKIRYFSIMDSVEFDNITKSFLDNLFNAFSLSNDKIILIDMLFSATNPSLGEEYFDNTKKIIVDRDPRDNFIGTRKEMVINAFMPYSDVKSFVEYYRLLRLKSEHDENALYIQYEDMIYNYYATTQKIMDFLGLNSRPKDEFKFFNPDISVRYTNFKKQLPDEKSVFEYIESKLECYLYDFKEYTPLNEQFHV